MHQDSHLISRLGGATKLAERLGFPLRKGGVQRVQNWKERGIPPGVELDNPWITAERKAMDRATTPQTTQTQEA